MRVCLLSAEYPPARGGVGDYTWHLAAALLAEGVECRVLTTARPGTPAEDPSGCAVDARVRDWGFASLKTVREALTEWRADVVHIQYQTAAYGMHPAINLLPLRFRRWRERPRIVTTFHDLRFPYLFPKAGRLRHLAAFALAAGSDRVVLVTPEHWWETPLAWLRRVQADLAGKTHVIPIGSNIAACPPEGYDRSVWRERLGVAPGELLLGYFGFINSTKGVDDLLVALHSVRGRGVKAKLLIIGGRDERSNAGDASWQARIDALISELRLADAVSWTGFAEPQEVSAHLLATDLCVLPFRDGATFQRGSLLAALVHGLPIVSTTAPPVASSSEPLPHGWTEVNQGLLHGENVWLAPPASPRELADAIERVGGDAELRAYLSAGARNLAARLGWDGIARRHVDIYRSLLESMA